MSSFQLKIFAMILMVFDHLASYIPGMPVWFNFIGRIVAPIFFFFLVEGFFNTRSREKYAARLFAWSLVMFAGSKFVIIWIIYVIGYYLERDNSAAVETISWVLKEYFSRLI